MARNPDLPIEHYDRLAVRRLAQAICGQTAPPKKDLDEPRPS